MDSYTRHILGLIANGLCFSILDDRHPGIRRLLDLGMIEKTVQGLGVTQKGQVELGDHQTAGTRAG